MEIIEQRMMKRVVNIIISGFCIVVFNAYNAQAQDDYIVHTIKKGEVITVLAKKYGITPEDIARINNFGVNRILHVGDKVKLPAHAQYRDLPDSVLNPPKPSAVQPAASPAATTTPAGNPGYVMHTVEKGEVYSVLAKKYNVTVDEILSINNFKGGHILHAGDKIKLPAKAADNPAAETTATVSQQPVETTPEATVVPAEEPATIEHVIAKGERFPVLAKKYNVTVADILKVNNFKANHIPRVGDKIKLPASAKETAVAAEPVPQQPQQQPPVSQQPAEETTPATTAAAPITHTVKPKETLYSIARKYNVTIADIKNWNNLTGNNISTGQQLSINGNAPQQPAAANRTASSQQAPPPAPVTTTPAAPKVTTTANNKPVVSQAQPAVINEANIPASGYFSGMFGKDVAGRKLKTTNGAAMTFKTASGWSDKKYYVLMNDVPPGAVVQVTNEEGKAIYAKVLWSMGDEKDNEGLTFRISDAAAAALDIKNTKFQVAVTYYE